MNLPKIIDNNRKVFLDIIHEQLPKHDTLSIATGYWDIEGMKLVIDQLDQYKKVRILIGREPLLKRDNTDGKQGPEPDYPDADFFDDLQKIDPSPELGQVVVKIKNLIDAGVLEVRVYRRTFLHAKCYIFGDYGSDTAIGVIGSSNFTRNGMTSNTELNALESDHRVVTFEPKNETQEVGHLFWFNEMWNDEKTEEWTGEFLELVRTSPHGDMLFSPRDMYFRALYELYRHEIDADKEEIIHTKAKTLLDFQERNVKNLKRILDNYGVAMLADSVGLGKTITAMGVIKQYKNQRVVVIAPKALKKQWEQELAQEGLLNVRVISLQNRQEIIDQQSIDKYSSPALFVIDESHNLRSHNGVRYELVSDWIASSQNEESHVLLVTATPINNSLSDLTSQILLGARGDQDIFTLAVRTSEGQIVTRSFYEAIDNIRKRIQQVVAQGGENLNEVYQEARITLEPIIRNFVVRNTRQSIGKIERADGTIQLFPEVNIENVTYEPIHKNIEIEESFRSVVSFSVEQLADTMDTLLHPVRQVDDFTFAGDADSNPSIIYRIYQLILALSFVPYRWRMYDFKLYGKDKKEIREMRMPSGELQRVNMQLSLYGIMRTLFLKRLESSAYALEVSLQRYLERIQIFEQILRDEKIIINLSDIDDIVDEYAEDDGDQVSYDTEELIELARKKPQEVDSNFNVDAMLEDIALEKSLIEQIIRLVHTLKENDPKLADLKSLLLNMHATDADKKLLIFTFFADTIDYLKEKLEEDRDFAEIVSKTAFVSGRDRKHALHCADRFAPKAKDAMDVVEKEGELTYLFATDVLSEGQNLQDCGAILNYDLHWNPVRMVQRNGRINRLGSEHSHVTITNFMPGDDLETFLGLEGRIRRKIDLIKHAIGNDASIFGEDVDARSYIGLYSDDTEEAKAAYDALESSLDAFADDVFLKDLLDFYNEASEKEIRHMERLPFGSWGIVPQGLENPNDVVLFTQLAYENEVNKYVFFGNTKEANAIEVVQQSIALQMIRSLVTDKQIDTITLDKEQQIENMKRRGPQIARDTNVNMALTPSKEVVLNTAVQYDFSPEEITKLRATLATRNVNLGRKVTRLVRAINAAIKENIPADAEYKKMKELLVEPPEQPRIKEAKFLLGYTDEYQNR